MDTDSQMITAVPVEVAIGDAVYGDGDTRQAFTDAGTQPDCPSAGQRRHAAQPD